MGSQELEAGDTFNNHPVNVDGVMRASFLLPEVHNKLLCLAGVKEQVIVSASCGQVLYLLPVGSLIVVFDEANHRGVIRKLDDGVGSMYRPALHILEHYIYFHDLPFSLLSSFVYLQHLQNF